MKIKIISLILLASLSVSAAGVCDFQKARLYFEKQNKLQRDTLESIMSQDGASKKMQNAVFEHIMNYSRTFKDLPQVYNHEGQLLPQRLVGIDNDGNWILQEPFPGYDDSGKLKNVFTTVPYKDAKTKYKMSGKEMPDVMAPQRQDIEEKTMNDAQDGDQVNIGYRTYSVTVRDDGSKRFVTVDGRESFNRRAVPGFVKRSPDRRVVDRDEEDRRKKKEEVQVKKVEDMTPEELRMYREIQKPKQGRVFNFDDLPESARTPRDSAPERTPETQKMIDEISKPMKGRITVFGSDDTPTAPAPKPKSSAETGDLDSSGGGQKRSTTSDETPGAKNYQERAITPDEIAKDPVLKRITEDAKNLKDKTPAEVLKSARDEIAANPNSPRAKRLKEIWGDCL